MERRAPSEHQANATRRPTADLLGPTVIGVLAIAFSPAMYHSHFAMRAAVLVIVAGPCLVLLTTHARRDVPARAALVFVGVATLAAATSARPLAAFWGEANWGTGLLFVVACLGLWGWARTWSESARERCRRVLLVTFTINVAVAVLQQLDAVPTAMSMVDRPSGLLGNAVHFGAFSAAVAVVATRGSAVRSVADGLGLFAASAGVQLSGGRGALAMLVVALILIAARGRHLPSAALVFAVGIAGIICASQIPGAAPTATERSSRGTASGSLQPRLEAWRASADAVMERPLLGHGPGRFRAATSSHRTLASAKFDGEDRFSDAHNLFIEASVATGALGLLAFVAWVIVVVRSSRGWWACAACVLLLGHLFEPMSVAITPFLAMTAGMGMPLAALPLREVPRRNVAVALASMSAAVGVVAAGGFLIGETRLQQGSVDFDPGALRSAEGLLPPTWPTAALVTARVQGFYGAQDAGARQAAITAARAAVAADPTDDQTWLRLGTLEGVWGSKPGAARAYDEALRWNPWSVNALGGRAQAARDLGDTATLAATCRRLKQVTAKGSCGGRSLAEW